VTIVHRAQQLGRVLLDLFYPPFCVGCGRTGTLYCCTCRDATSRILPPLCPHCGLPQEASRICPWCLAHPTAIAGIRSAAVFEGPLRSAIHQFKYGYMRDLAAPLSDLLVSCWQEVNQSIDVIVPVPLHARRFKERGYNQSALLARRVGSALRIPVNCGCLHRNRHTVSQTRLSAQERARNVEGAFTCVGPDVQDKCVLLIDDVCTTGSTLGACSHALGEGGAQSVWALTVARPVPTKDI
jgi:competence protein ComFC